MKNGYKLFTILLLALFFTCSCKKSHYKVNTSSIKVDIKIKRLEKDLFSLDPGQVIPAVPGLKQKYGEFLQLFSFVINTGDINEPSFGDFLLRFCSDKQNSDVYALTMEKFPEVTFIESGLEDAFKHYLYYFPGKVVPEVNTCITGFNNSIITGDSLLGIGLDRYLGVDCEYYPRLNIARYLTARMTPENIVPDCIYGWAVSEWDFSLLKYPDENLLSGMIHEGKLRYFEKCMLPDTPDSTIFGFTPDQMKFCQESEPVMWQYLIENNLLFTTDQFTIRKLTGEAPFTSYFSKESPGKAAVWLGFRIVEAYMINNQSVKLEDMIRNTDVQEILGKAKYSPQ